MALDEPREQDLTVEEKGLKFLFDPYARLMVAEIQVDYDITIDDFAVHVPDRPESSC
jgi:Fe-S cluster assembly iron-binding protein IscA